MKFLQLTRKVRSSVLVSVLGGISAFGTTYYVDFDGGSNANSGVSTTAAWKQCPGDNSASGAALSTQLKAGDAVVFKGGVVYRGSVSLKWSGSASAGIVYDGNSAGTFGTGAAIIDGENTRSLGFTAVSGLSRITIKNFEIRNLKYTGNSATCSGITMTSPSYVTIAKCNFHDIGHWNNDGAIYPEGSGVYLVQPTFVTISGCQITKVAHIGIGIYGGQDCKISGNDIHHYITWGVDVTGDYRLCTRDTVCDNSIHDLYLFDTGFFGVATEPHTDYVFIRAGGGTHPVKNVVERNLFYNNYTFTDFGGTAMIFLSYADSSIIRNNVFINPHEYYPAYFCWTSAGTRFYNNTIYAPRANVSGIRFETNGRNDVRNNIIVGGNGALDYMNTTDLTSLVMDYNLIYTGNSSRVVAQLSPGASYSLATWKNKGYDAHSASVTSIDAIKFVSTAGYPTACQTMDLRLQPSSPAVNTGAVMPAFADDKNGTPRPQGAAWDKGAYEYAAVGSTQATASVRQSAPSAMRTLPSTMHRSELAALFAATPFTLCNASGKTVSLAKLRTNGAYFLKLAGAAGRQKIVVIE